MGEVVRNICILLSLFALRRMCSNKYFLKKSKHALEVVLKCYPKTELKELAE